MANTKFKWDFPLKGFFFMKLETFTIAVLAIFVFFYTFLQSDQRWFNAVFSVIAFIALYVLVSYIIQKIRKVEENYHLSENHLNIVRKAGSNVKKEKVHLKDIKHHKLDKFFLGGYLVTHSGKKHVLFFNTKDEAEKFEGFLKKHLGSAGKAVKKPVKRAVKRVKAVKKRVTKKKTTKKKVVKKNVVKRKVAKKRKR